jgi:hypothetical protein
MITELYKKGDRVILFTGVKGTVVLSNGELVVEKDWNATGEPYSSLSSVKEKIS